jgi:hypothetical protein
VHALFKEECTVYSLVEKMRKKGKNLPSSMVPADIYPYTVVCSRSSAMKQGTITIRALLHCLQLAGKSEKKRDQPGNRDSLSPSSS